LVNAAPVAGAIVPAARALGSIGVQALLAGESIPGAAQENAGVAAGAAAAGTWCRDMVSWAMTALRKQIMSVDEFLAWAERQPDRWELVEGIPTAMPPERVVHGDVKYRVARALDVAIARAQVRAQVPCRFVLDSAAVRIDPRSLYQPDALVYCGEPVSGDALEIRNPVVVFEVLSPGNAVTDLRDKLQGYFRVASIQHCLIVDPDKRIVIHHARGAGDVVATRIVSEGTVRLDPPGIEITVGELFG
jgi:Uma2 family endonuclease